MVQWYLHGKGYKTEEEWEAAKDRADEII